MREWEKCGLKMEDLGELREHLTGIHCGLTILKRECMSAGWLVDGANLAATEDALELAINELAHTDAEWRQEVLDGVR